MEVDDDDLTVIQIFMLHLLVYVIIAIAGLCVYGYFKLSNYILNLDKFF